MNRRNLALSAAALFAAPFAGRIAPAFAAKPAFAVSDPVVHDNLAVFFLRGASAAGPTPLTLQEALARGSVTVIETGDVNQLLVENRGDQEVFIQSGEIVKGGKQDRVLTVSLLLPPNSGQVPIASFCVEQGRWSPRGKEDAGRFAAAPAMAPSREAKLAMNAAPRVADPAPIQSPVGGQRTQTRVDLRGSETSQRQQAVWASVARTQAKLSGNLGKDVKAEASASSLQLALENDTLKAAQLAYVAALRAVGEREDDVIGYVFAINGKLNSGDVYASNALFRKLWPKLIEAAATESIGEKDAPRGPSPSVAEVQAFLAAAEAGAARAQNLVGDGVMESRDNDRSLFVETRRAKEGFVHRSYVAK